ncbi:proton-conducting transporter transmembrane domain-containing protein, partial [Paenibacillus phytohabitans]
LLFLAAGSVIHAVHTQNIEEMGGLWKKLRVTGPLFLIGTLAISGVPLFSGFFSKDEILVATWVQGNYVLFWLAVIAAFFTAFYMFRLFFMVFTGESRGSHTNVKESPSWMTIPMMVLGVLAIIAGYVNTPWFGSFLGDWLTEGTNLYGPGHIEGPGWIVGVATFASLIGILLAYAMYQRKSIPRDFFSSRAPITYSIVSNKYFIDEFYNMTIVYVTKVFSLFLRYIDEFLVGGIVKGVAQATQGIGKLGAKLQNGQVQMYTSVAFVGLAILLLVVALTGGYLR